MRLKTQEERRKWGDQIYIFKMFKRFDFLDK